MILGDFFENDMKNAGINTMLITTKYSQPVLLLHLFPPILKELLQLTLVLQLNLNADDLNPEYFQGL